MKLGFDGILQVYIALEPFKSDLFGDFAFKTGDGQDEIAKEAFRSVLVLGPDDSIYFVPRSLAQKWRTQLSKLNNVAPERSWVFCAELSKKTLPIFMFIYL